MEDNTVKDIIHGFAVGARAISNATDNVSMDAAARAAAVVLGLVSDLLDGRSVEEAKEILRKLVQSGTTPISEDELDAQVKSIVDELS